MYGHREERYHLTTQDRPQQITIPQYSDHQTYEIWSDAGIIPPHHIRDCIEHLHRNLIENEETTSQRIGQILPERIAIDPNSIAIVSREKLMQFSMNCGIPTIGVPDMKLAIQIIQYLINDYSQEIPKNTNLVNQSLAVYSLAPHSGCTEYCTACTTPYRNPTGTA